MSMGKNRLAKRTLLLVPVIGALVFAGFQFTVLSTEAAVQDQANLNLSETGFGSGSRFDIGVVLPDNTVEQANEPEGFNWEVDGAHTLIPGRSISTDIAVFNNTPKLLADTTFEVMLRNDDGAVSANIPNIVPFLRFSAEVDGAVLFTDVEWSDARGSIGKLSARGAEPLEDGAQYDPGEAGSESVLTLTIRYLDEPGVEELNGGQAALALRFGAESTK